MLHCRSSPQGLVLDSVFTSQNPFFIFGLVLLLVFLGAFEAVYNRSKRRFHGMVLYKEASVHVVCYHPPQLISCRVFSWSLGRPICSIPSSNLGTYKAHSNCRDAVRQRDLGSCNRHQPLSHTSRVCLLTMRITAVRIRRRLRCGSLSVLQDGKWEDSCS